LKNPFELINIKLPHPLCIVEDRYGGAYSGTRFLVFNMSPYSVQELPIDASDIDCENFWNGKDKDYDVNDYIIGKGETPEEAVWNLILLLQDKVEKNSNISNYRKVQGSEVEKLDEAIKHAEEVAEEQIKLCKRYDDASGYSRSHDETIRTADAKRCKKCAKEHRQLAEWLKDYKRLILT